MEFLKGLTRTGSKPGIIVRLSNLIILQVLFVFAALALILFVPDSDRSGSAEFRRRGHALYVSGQAIADGVKYQSLWSEGYYTAGEPYSILHDRLAAHPAIERAALVRVGDSTRLDVLYVYAGTSVRESSDDSDEDISDFVDPVALRHVAEQTQSGPAHPAVSTSHLAYYHKLPSDWEYGPLVLVVAAEHGLAVSSRAGLQYAVFVLFLCAALISLLTVSLLLRKFKRPLDQIISGLSETAEGKMHHLAELENDPELGKLARAYNQMTRRLWEDRRQLDSFVNRLASTNADLKESQTFLSTLVDCSPLSVVVTSPDRRIVLFNRAATAEFGYRAEEVIGRPFDLLLAENSDHAVFSPEDPGSREFEIICRRKDGVLFPAFANTGDVCTDDGRLLARLYICRDITDSRNFQEMIIRLDRYYTKGEMAGDIAHEINNYLAVLLGNVELMPMLLSRGDHEKVNKKLEVMKTTLEKIARFADGLLDSSPDTVRLEPASLNQAVENVIAFLKPQNKFDVVEVVKELSTEIPIMHIDTGQVQQLLVNLIYNAAEALAETDGERTIRVATALVRKDGEQVASITVRDNGPGVVPNKVPLLFKTRFTTKKRGHGIGLITCRKIVDNHGGSVDYRFDNGATFTVHLPVKVRAAGESELTADTLTAIS
ncbi:MAG: ATP-binding protein [Candidatus Zixiibacteriota bacterium]